jgi:hypothetical protein
MAQSILTFFFPFASAFILIEERAPTFARTATMAGANPLDSFVPCGQKSHRRIFFFRGSSKKNAFAFIFMVFIATSWL